jgi:hypothetical protein
MVETYNGTNYSTKNGIRQKIMDYIFYSVVQGKNVPSDQVESCADGCGAGLFKQKCCASFTAVMGPTTDYWYACVDQSLAAADMTMNMMGANVAITCVESSAMKVAGVAMTATLALISIM